MVNGQSMCIKLCAAKTYTKYFNIFMYQSPLKISNYVCFNKRMKVFYVICTCYEGLKRWNLILISQMSL